MVLGRGMGYGQQEHAGTQGTRGTTEAMRKLDELGIREALRNEERWMAEEYGGIRGTRGTRETAIWRRGGSPTPHVFLVFLVFFVFLKLHLSSVPNHSSVSTVFLVFIVFHRVPRVRCSTLPLILLALMKP